MTQDIVRAEPKDLGVPALHKQHSNIRSLKMMVPTCHDDSETGFRGCQDQPGAEFTLWWKECIAKGHDPYHRKVRRSEMRPELVEVCVVCEKPQSEHPIIAPRPDKPDYTGLDEAGRAALKQRYDESVALWREEINGTHVFEPSGRHLRTGVKEYEWFEEQANLKQVQITPRTTGTRYGIDPLIWYRANGYIFPQDHPSRPLKEFCQYHNCWSQKIKVRDRDYGNYCDETAAKLVKLDSREKNIEAYNMERREEQLEAVKIG